MSARLIYVMGASGVGKDSLLGYARSRCRNGRIVFAHRYITRADGGGENHISLTDAEFDLRADTGLFAMQWRSHTLRYGIGIEIDQWLARGCTVVVNGSRAYVPHALERYPAMTVVHVTAPPHVLATRLAARGRETRDEIAARLARSAPFELPADVALVTLENGGKLDDAGELFVDALMQVAHG